MRMTILAATALAMASAVAIAQQEQVPTTPPTDAPPAITAPPAPSPAVPVPGANSFTEEQARERVTDAGYTDVGTLTLDANGVWRGMASKGGQSVNVSVDYQGNVVEQ